MEAWKESGRVPWWDRPDIPGWGGFQIQGREGSAKCEHTLFGSLTNTYFPSDCFVHKSIIALTMPHPLASEIFS